MQGAYTWRNGRELASMTDGATTWSYTYDANGMRTSRTNGTTTYNYVYNGSQLTQMTVGNDTLYFTYGLLGPTTVTWNGTTYYYSLSGQGDVTGIFDEDGNPVVTYNWDNAWGYNPIPEGVMASTLGTLNPLRYRSYVYDTETGYYYLQSRYYDPEMGRFINADWQLNLDDVHGANLFAYCLNNPVNQIDPSGTASYENSYTVVVENGKVVQYNATTVIKLGSITLTYRYTITPRGVIRFDFGENSYRILSRFGLEKLLAEAMYMQAKEISSNFLFDRTIEGLRTELQGHWLGYILTGHERFRIADMGTAIQEKPGYDDNAWVWEAGSTVTTFIKCGALIGTGLIAGICNMLR